MLPARCSPESWVETQREAAAPSGARAALALPTASRAARRDGAAESIRGESVSELPAAATQVSQPEAVASKGPRCSHPGHRCLRPTNLQCTCCVGQS